MKTIGQNIRRLRKNLKMSGCVVAVEIGVQKTVYYRWETDEVTPSLLNAISLADFFGCSVDELVGRTEIRTNGQKKDE